MTAVLDHLAIGTRALEDGWELFGGILGGRWLYGGDSPGFWWGELEFAAGPRIELLTPTGDGGFLDRFLATRGAGPHHLTFVVTDIGAALDRIRAAGLEPVGVNLADPAWQEAFLHPRSAHGIVIQVAQQAGPPPVVAPPQDLPEPGPAARFEEIEHHVSDLDGAVRLFRDVLDGQLEAAEAGGAELSWSGGKRLRLVRANGLPRGGTLRRVRFARADAGGGAGAGGGARAGGGGGFSAWDCERAERLAGRLGVSVELAG